MLISEAIENAKKNLKQLDEAIQEATNTLDPSNEKDNETIEALIKNRQAVKEMLGSLKLLHDLFHGPVSDSSDEDQNSSLPS